MSSNTHETKTTFSILMHDALNDISTILSIAQFCLISKEMSPDLRTEVERIVDTGKQMSEKLKLMAEVIQQQE
ncbi:MAG: hypothetical protein AB1801_01730 [Chloroflexota bacterium]